MRALIISFILFAVIFMNCKPKINKNQNLSLENSSINKLNKNQCIDTIVNDSIFFNYLAFKKINYSTSQISQFFKNEFKIDSIDKKGTQGDKYYIYTYSDKESKIDFMVSPKGSVDKYFYIIYSDIRSNYVKLFNGIEINMPREQIFKRLGLQKTNCDTLIIIGGDSYERLKMVFHENKLQRILFPSTGVISTE